MSIKCKLIRSSGKLTPPPDICNVKIPFNKPNEDRFNPINIGDIIDVGSIFKGELIWCNNTDVFELYPKHKKNSTIICQTSNHSYNCTISTSMTPGCNSIMMIPEGQLLTALVKSYHYTIRVKDLIICFNLKKDNQFEWIRAFYLS
jgi:hypothetical protein